jgi:hypothetical protein
MAFFTDDELHAMKIKRMIFHLVGPKRESLVILPEVDPGKFEQFFLDRIKTVNFGHRYVFSGVSSTRARLKRILDNDRMFVPETEKLAERFNELHRPAAAWGAFLVFLLSIGEATYFALLKHDDEKVLAYDVKEDEKGRKTVDLEALEKTFVQNKDALQKAALIKVTDDGGALSVLDRKNQQRVADYFEAFLEAKREFDDAELTFRLVNAARKVIRASEDLVPPEVYRELHKKTHEAAKQGAKIDGEHLLDYLSTVIGRKLNDDEPLAQRFQDELKSARIAGMPVAMTPDKVVGAVSVRYRTKKGIEIRVPSEFSDLIDTSGPTIIIKDKLEKIIDDTK